MSINVHFRRLPKRWASDAPVIEYRKSLYIWLNSQLTAEPYVFGVQLTLVDCYLCTMRTWGPGHEWFQDNAPNINAIADAVCQIPKLQEVLKECHYLTIMPEVNVNESLA